MSHRTTRLAADALEARAVPAATVAETFRPLTFTLTGTVTTTTTPEVPASDAAAPPIDDTPDRVVTPPAEPTATYDGVFTARGQIDYTSATSGTSGTVNVVGSGRGATDVGSYSNTFRGTMTLADDAGEWTIVDPYTGTETWTSGRGSTTDPVGPLTGSGAFSVANYTVSADWDATADGSATHTRVRGTVAQTGVPQTDLKITGADSTPAEGGGFDLTVTAEVTGQLMKAATQTGAAARLTAKWESDDQSEVADLDVPIAWNAGQVVVTATGLVPPSWATRLVLKIDSGSAVKESDETNNAWAVEVSDGTVPLPPIDNPTVPNPTVPPGNALFQIAADGTNHILWTSPSGQVVFRVPTYDSSFTGAVNLATGDVTGDGVQDAVVAAGYGGGPHIKVFDGSNGRQVMDFMAYEEEFRGGVNLAVGDVNGDGHADIVTGTGAGGSPRVRVFDGADGAVLKDFFAFEEEFRGGVDVLATDLNGDDQADVVAAAGPGGAPLIKVFDGASTKIVLQYYAADPDTREGVTLGVLLTQSGTLVVAADTNGVDGVHEYRPGNTAAGEPALVPLPGGDWVDVVAV